MREAVSLLIRAATLLVLLALVLVASAADLLLVLPMLFLGGPFFACTSIAIDAASGGLRRLFGLEDCDQ